MPEFHAETALLPGGWADEVRITVDEGGAITGVEAGAGTSGAERLEGAVLPGMGNLHSHAFQRAMAGLAERHAGGNFWSWREVMYRFLGRIGPDDLEAITAQLYVEMLKAGYTAVGEFHYLHHDLDGAPYADAAEMSGRLARAAQRAGIGLTLLPVLYAAGGFGGAPTGDGQKRFAGDVEWFAGLMATLAERFAGDPQVGLGVAPHSLRAVPPEVLAGMLADADPGGPVHIHVAEQVLEVEDCVAWSGARPVQWLLANAPVDGRWCLIHATHMSQAETAALAASGAVAGLCPTTEANLGDGLFALGPFLEAGGRFGIGSDSQVSVSPVEELRWLEYGRRLIDLRRNVSATSEQPSTGRRLYDAALAGGAQALGRPIGAIEEGRRADLVVLDTGHPTLVARQGDALLDSYLFSGNATPVRHVMVGGRWTVRDGVHAEEHAVAEAYATTLKKLIGDCI